MRVINQMRFQVDTELQRNSDAVGASASIARNHPSPRRALLRCTPPSLRPSLARFALPLTLGHSAVLQPQTTPPSSKTRTPPLPAPGPSTCLLDMGRLRRRNEPAPALGTSPPRYLFLRHDPQLCGPRRRSPRPLPRIIHPLLSRGPPVLTQGGPPVLKPWLRGRDLAGSVMGVRML